MAGGSQVITCFQFVFVCFLFVCLSVQKFNLKAVQNCHIRSFVCFYSSPHSPNYPHRFQIDKDSFPTTAFPDIDFVNSVCPCAGLSMLNTQSTGASGRGNGIQNEWMVKSAHNVSSQVRSELK